MKAIHENCRKPGNRYSPHPASRNHSPDPRNGAGVANCQSAPISAYNVILEDDRKIILAKDQSRTAQQWHSSSPQIGKIKDHLAPSEYYYMTNLDHS
jgi:hypothetical protein